MPVLVHRLGFGGWERVAGLQWMLITTTGRHTGRPHRVMVDVLAYDRPADTYYVEVAYGRRSDWYRNILAHPVFHAQVGRRRFRATAAPLSPEQAGDLMVAFFRRRRGYTRAVLRLLGLGTPTEADLRAMGRATPALAIRPQPA